MKQLDLEILSYRKKFRIHLGSGQWLTFDTKTSAEKFLRKYKRVLNDNVKMLNLLQPNVNALFRQSYFQLGSAQVRKIYEHLNDYDDRFEYIFKSFSSGNKNAFVFSNINSCFDSLLQIVEELHVFAQRYKNFNITCQTTPLLKHLQYLQSSFNADKRCLLVNEAYKKVKQLQPIRQDEKRNYS